MNIPGIVQVGRDFLDDCDGRTVILDATGGQCTLDPDAAARQQAETRICELQRENEEMGQLHALPSRTKDGQPFELLGQLLWAGGHRHGHAVRAHRAWACCAPAT